MSSGSGSRTYGIDIPFVKPYFHEMSVAEERPLRADARRNREAILKAAKKVFAKQGTVAQMDDIARAAKLGVGTLYRHFPTKDALIRALMADRVEHIATFIREGLEDADAFRGLTDSMRRGAELAARDKALSGIFTELAPEAFAEFGVSLGLFDNAAALVARAKEQGTLREDFDWTDIPVLMCGVMGPMHQMAPSSTRPGPWMRHIQLVIDGMRACPDNGPLPDEPLV